jgi:YD repeat-containing protein
MLRARRWAGYDFRGELSSVATDATSVLNAAPDPATAAKVQYVYDQRGWLLQTIDARGNAVTPDAGNANTAYATTYTYDGLGRVLSTTVWLGAGNLRTTQVQYDDAGYSILTRLANGLVKTATFDTAGQLRSEANSSGATSLGTTSYRYDGAGRLRQVIDANGIAEHHLYDAAGRKVGLVSGSGALSELVYDRFDQVVKTVRYADRLSSEQLASLTVNGQPSTVTLTQLKAQLPSTIGRASDRIERSVYDAAGRVQFTIDASGALTQFFYHGAGRATDTVQFATRVSIAASIDALTPDELPSPSRRRGTGRAAPRRSTPNSPSASRP